MSLTKKQQQVLDAVIHLRAKGVPPTVREIGQLIGLSSPATVQKHLKTLEGAGLIEMSGKSRGIRVLRGSGVPVVGRIAAGEPISPSIDPHAGELTSLQDYPEVAIDPNLFLPGAAPGELVALQVVGDSMIEAGIFDRDIVIIRRQSEVEVGEIAAVSIDGEGTLKRWGGRTAGKSGRREAGLRLLPANERFEPIHIEATDHKDVWVFGKYLGLIRGEHVGRV